jgi:hypothetical protein
LATMVDLLLQFAASLKVASMVGGGEASAVATETTAVTTNLSPAAVVTAGWVVVTVGGSSIESKNKFHQENPPNMHKNFIITLCLLPD